MSATARVVHLTSRSNALLVELRRLARHPGDYRKNGRLMLEGEHLCRAWAERGPANASHALIADAAWQAGRHVELAHRADTIVVVAESALADASTLDTPAPIAFIVATPSTPAIDAQAATVVLDRIQDAGNVGSILRSASAFGFGQVIALKGTAALWSAKVLRAGMGAHLGLRLIEGIDDLSREALTVPLIGSSSHASDVLGAAALPWPHAWVFGNEGEGVADLLLNRCATTLRIPQAHGEESLNVAVAAGICLYQSARGRA